MRDLDTLSDRIFRIEEAYELARAATGFGVWDWDIKRGTLIWDAAMHALFGTDPETWPGDYSGFANQLVHEDLPAVETALSDCMKNRTPYRYRFRLKNGRKIYGLGKCVFDHAGQPRRMVGICIEAPPV